jgi:hypothetical protein
LMRRKKSSGSCRSAVRCLCTESRSPRVPTGRTFRTPRRKENCGMRRSWRSWPGFTSRTRMGGAGRIAVRDAERPRGLPVPGRAAGNRRRRRENHQRMGALVQHRQAHAPPGTAAAIRAVTWVFCRVCRRVCALEPLARTGPDPLDGPSLAP